ncbi:Sin recombinase [Loigolactobacillus backii]|uniref:recombinase family protein n=1 Tax=Loigolactobacillus backii TaxID=375175 RepID=UPI000C1C8A1B|nr:recombinase family protein [Loigolactobacillus backii]PIO83709.1 Sin recombinase [Loigolactobacillus backii]
MALVFYARVSSRDQNLNRQLARAEAVQADRVFTDKLSGKDTKRPGLKDLLKFVREDDIVEIVSLDRLSRNYDDIRSIVEQLKNKGVKLVIDDLPQTNTGNSLTDKFMLDMMINLMSFVAENERSKIKERQKQGIAQAKLHGVYKGRPFKFTADSSNREGRLVYASVNQAYLSGDYSSKTQLARDNGLSRQQLY